MDYNLLTDSFLESYGVGLDTAKRYAENLQLHLHHVKECGNALGVAPYQLQIHDDSKWTILEFPHYAMYFYGNPTKSNPTNFQHAVLHHYHNNPHHWQTWLIPDGSCLPGADCENGALEMPRQYVLEMVADWQAAGLAYSGTADMTNWLTLNLPKIKLHSRSKDYLLEILTGLGYKL